MTCDALANVLFRFCSCLIAFEIHGLLLFRYSAPLAGTAQTESKSGVEVPRLSRVSIRMARKKKPVDFERSLRELEGLVERMEAGELSLEDSLATYERGIRLSRVCQQALDEAEQRIEILTEKSGRAELEPFEPDDEPSD